MAKKFVLTGDIHRSAKVVVEAETSEEAIELAEAGKFEIQEEFRNCDRFTFDGGPDHIEEA